MFIASCLIINKIIDIRHFNVIYLHYSFDRQEIIQIINYLITSLIDWSRRRIPFLLLQYRSLRYSSTLLYLSFCNLQYLEHLQHSNFYHLHLLLCSAERCQSLFPLQLLEYIQKIEVFMSPSSHPLLSIQSHLQRNYEIHLEQSLMNVGLKTDLFQ